MPKPLLHFSHANGFPALCYDAMLGALEARYRVGYVEVIGESPRFPVTDRWPHLVEELIGTLEQRYRGEPVCAVGHSLGGYLGFLAAVRRPELFRAIVLLDAPVIGAIRGGMLGATKRMGVIDRVTPAGATRDRRSTWPSAEDAKAHFRSRPLYRHFTEQCLDDYVRHGLVRHEAGWRLRIDPALETQIYRTIPHDMGRHVRALAVPAGFIGGRRSDVVRRVGLAAMRKRFALRDVPGGHLFPFEHPREAAAAIIDLLETLVPGGSTA